MWLREPAACRKIPPAVAPERNRFQQFERSRVVRRFRRRVRAVRVSPVDGEEYGQNSLRLQIDPVMIGAVLGVVVLGEPVGFSRAAGCLLMVGGVILISCS